MKVLLIDVDGKLPNIALHKLAIWHESRGDEVIWNLPLFLDQADKVYVSTILTKSRPQVENLVGLRPDAVVGGTGTWGFIDPPPKLPAEVEAVKARINFGFTSRGCIRKCPFCLVPQVEGKARVVGDIFDVWDGKSKKLTLFDNNILALPDHFEKVAGQLVAAKVKVDFNQGLDIRLVTPHIVELLKSLRLAQLRFAFDDPKLARTIEKKVALLNEGGLKQIYFYVLVGYNTTFEEDLARLNLLRRLGCLAYVMRYETVYAVQEYITLARWANMYWTFAKYEWPEFSSLFGPGKARH